jgi:hypothetical protein
MYSPTDATRRRLTGIATGPRSVERADTLRSLPGISSRDTPDSLPGAERD